MRETGLMRDSLERFREHLIQEERAVNTIEKYDRDIRYFLQQMEPGEALTKELVLEYKRRLAETYKTSSFLPEDGEGAYQRRIPKAGGCGERKTERAAEYADSSHLQHGDSGQRAPIYHGGGAERRSYLYSQ